MSALVELRNRLFEAREKRRGSFSVGLVGTCVAAGLVLGVGAELLVLAGVLAWMAWDSRPRILLAMGLYEKSARAARTLALEAGPSFRGDIFRLSEVAATLNLGKLAEAKQALRDIDPRRLTPRTRLVYFLSQATLWSRLGDGETALVMVEAAESEARGLGEHWDFFPRMNRSLALFELGRYEQAARELEAMDSETIFPQARAYLFNNLAWAKAMGRGDPQEALDLARRAVRIRGDDPYCLGTLGFCMVRAGQVTQSALNLLERSLREAPGRSPSGRALLLSAGIRVLRELGDGKRARKLEDELSELSVSPHHLERLQWIEA